MARVQNASRRTAMFSASLKGLQGEPDHGEGDREHQYMFIRTLFKKYEPAFCTSRGIR
jgi:hypothetical protein